MSLAQRFAPVILPFVLGGCPKQPVGKFLDANYLSDGAPLSVTAKGLKRCK